MGGSRECFGGGSLSLLGVTSSLLPPQKRDFPEGIPECGTDALRFALCAYTAQGTRTPLKPPQNPQKPPQNTP